MSKYPKENLYKVLEKISDSILPSLLDECIQNNISIQLKVNSKGKVEIISTEKTTVGEKQLKHKHTITQGIGVVKEKLVTNRIK